jgi:uracil-DNA glycosylase family 4
MDHFSEALGHAHATLLDVQAGPGRAPRVAKTSLQRLRRAAAKKPAAAASSKGEAASPAAPPRTDWTWEELEKATKGCTKCPHLVASRTQVVFGVGNRKAELMFVGEAPGADEDAQGEPFVGRAGALLTKIIEAMGTTREKIYIGNVLKCRPDMPAGVSGNRKPKADEMATCLPWLNAQIGLIRPKAIVALGATAAEGLLGETAPMKELRGRWFTHEGIPVLVTYHPAYLLRNQTLAEKRKVWEDMLLVMEKLRWPISEKQRGFFQAAG